HRSVDRCGAIADPVDEAVARREVPGLRDEAELAIRIKAYRASVGGRTNIGRHQIGAADDPLDEERARTVAVGEIVLQVAHNKDAGRETLRGFEFEGRVADGIERLLRRRHELWRV